MVSWRKVKTLKRWLPVALAGVILASGCTPAAEVSKETDERSYRRGKSLLREGRRDEALQAFLTVISTRGDAAESNLEAGLIYLNHIKDPLAAIYHFRGYLALNPEGEHAGFVEELIQTAQKDFAQSLPGNPFEDTIDRVNLMETVKDLQEENRTLKEQVLSLQRDRTEQESQILRYREAIAQASRQPVQPGQPAEVAPIVIAPAEPDPADRPAQTPESYTVQAGDTLSRISDRVYGTTGRWMDIFQANRDQLPSPNALKPGQVLRIP